MMQLLYGPDASEFAALGGAPAPETSVEPGESYPAPSGGGNAAEAFSAPSASSPDQSSPAAPAPTPADPNQRTQQPQWQSIRDAAQAAGFQFGADVTDDRQALQFLLARANASKSQNVYEQLGRQLAPKSDQILSYLRQQGGAPQPQARPAWEAPEFDERWAACVDRDPGTGLFVAKQGFPPQIAEKVNEYVQWKQNFDRNPAGVLNQMVEAKAEERARAVFQEQYGQVQRDGVIQSIVAENNQWMYARDAQGNPMRNFDGQQVVTPVGARYVHHLRAVVAAGVQDPRQQDQLAKQLVRGEYAQNYYTNQAAQANQSADPQFQQAQGHPNVNQLQALPADQRRRNPAATEPSEIGLSLAERLRRDLQSAGVSNDDVFNSVGR